MIVNSRCYAVVAVVLAVALAPTAGCRKKAEEKVAEEMMEQALRKGTGRDAHVELEKGKVAIEADGVKTEIAETTSWPREMFKDVPPFTSGKIERVATSREAGGKLKFNIYYVDVDPDAVNSYAELLNKGGWQATVMQMGDKGVMLNAQKGNMAINFPCSREDNRGTLMVYDFQN
jgi:hypothetical protein